nr:dehydration-responsive element-binding protein 1A-like [Lolium perenne]
MIPPRRRPSSGYHGVRARPSGRFDAEIRSDNERIRLGTFDTAHEAARVYDVVAWRLGCSRRTMNFHDVFKREQAEMLAPPPPVITREKQRRQRELEQRLLIAERDEAMRLEWARRFPEDVAATEAFYAQNEEEKAAVKAKKKASREKRRAESAARKAATAKKAARKEEEKKKGAGPSTIVLSSSFSFQWTTTPVSETTPSTHSSDFDWESDE